MLAHAAHTAIRSDAGAIMAYPRNTEIFCENEPADYLYQVVDGTVRTYKILSDGRRQIGGFHLPGDIFGLEFADDRAASTEATTDARVPVIKLVKSAHERVASFLLEMAQCAPAGNSIALPMSRQDIAEYLGLTIETVSRTLSALESAAAIEVPTSRRIVFNRTALSRLNG